MKKDIKTTEPEKIRGLTTQQINRMEAFRKTGYVAAAAMMLLLGTGKAQAQTSVAPDSPDLPPTGGFP